MMRKTSILVGLAMLCLMSATAQAACDGEAWISLEVVAGEIAGDDLAEFIEIDRQGCVLSYYAAFDTRAGSYRRQLSAAEQQSLSDQVLVADIASIDLDRTKRMQAQRLLPLDAGGAAQAVYVSDADMTRLRIRSADADRVWQWPSPEFYAELIPDDPDLRKLAALVKRVRAEGADARRIRTGGQR